MIDYKNLLNKLHFHNFNDLPPSDQKRFDMLLKLSNNPNLQVYIKTYEQVIEFQDMLDLPLWRTKLLLSAIVIFENEQLLDKFIIPTTPFRVRNIQEINDLNDMYESLLSDLSQFEQETEEYNNNYA